MKNIDWKIFTIRFVGLIVLAALHHFLLYPLVVNMLVLFKAIPEELMDKAFSSVLIMKSYYVFLGSMLLGFISLFCKGNWRNILYFSPLYAPSVFAVIYTLLQ